MLKVSVREIRAHAVRFALSILAVVLGVAFVAGTFNLRTMLEETFASIVASSIQGDVYLRGADVVSSGCELGSDSRNRIEASLAEAIEGTDGVAVALPDIQGPVVLVGADGTAVINGQAPSIGIALHADAPSTRILEGRAPRGDSEIAVDSVALAASGLRVGEETTIVIDEPRPVTVVGVTQFDAPPAGATLVFLSPETAEAAFAPDGLVASISVYVDDGSDPSSLLEPLRAVVGDESVQVLTGDDLRREATETITEAIGFLSTFLLVFAAIALFVGAFIISNTFAMSVRQRQREYALLRAIGASPVQVFAVVLGQAAVVGLAGSGLGFASGLGLVELVRMGLARFGMELGETPAADPAVLLACVLLGTAVSLVAALVPARRAALTAPVEAMRDDVTVTERSLRGRALVGGALLIGGAAATVHAGDGAQWWLGAGAAGVLVGMLTIAPVIARAVLGVLAWPLAAAIRPLGRLARGNVTRNPRRTANTAGALMIGMALVAACTVLAASATVSVTAIVNGETRADLIVQSATGSVPADVGPVLTGLEGVERVDSLRFGSVRVSTDAGQATGLGVIGVPGSAIGTTLQIRALDGEIASLSQGDAVVRAGSATEYGWRIGDDLTLRTDAGEVTARIGAITDSQLLGTPVIVEERTFSALLPTEAGQILLQLVEAEPGVDPDLLQERAAEALTPFVVVAALTTEEYTDQVAGQVEQALVIIYALLGLSIVIAILGIVNTLALAVIERTREIGLVRAVGLGRLQLAGTIVIESVLTAVFGTALGLAVGVALAAALRSVYADVGLTVLSVPLGQLLAVLALSVVVGVVAAVWPAIRAARLPVLHAIAQE